MRIRLDAVRISRGPCLAPARLVTLGSIDSARLNVKGSSLAAGHPFAATGTRILAVAAKLLAEKGSGRALISVCTAGGMGVAAVVERE